MFETELHAAYPDASHPRRKAFDHLAGLAGVEAAYELLALITFLVFIWEDPAGMFDQLAPAVANQADGFAALSAAQLLDRLGWADNYEEYLDRVAAGSRSARRSSSTRCARPCAWHGRSALIETLARPGTHLLALGEDELRAIEPPLIVYPLRDGGLVHHRNGLARGDDSAFGLPGHRGGRDLRRGRAARLAEGGRVQLLRACRLPVPR